METMKKRRLKIAGDEQGSKIPIKREEEWLAEDSHPPGFKLNKELLPSIRTEKNPFHADSEANAVQRFTPVPQTDEYIKTELILNEEWIDNLNELEAHVLFDPQLVGPDISVKESKTDEFCSASDSPKRLRNVDVRMLSNQLGEAQSINPCPPTTDDHSIKSNRRSTFICEECGSSYTRKSNLKMHILRRHVPGASNLPSQARFECGICSCFFKTKTDLKAHLRIHSKDRGREVVRDLCGKTYYENSSLSRHKKIHTGDGYPCKVCGHRFTENRSLKRHMVRRQHFENPQQFTSQSSINDAASMKTEPMSDEEFIVEENGNESVSHTEGTLHPAQAEDKKQQTGIDTAGDSSKRLQNVDVRMLSNQLGEVQSITPCPPTTDDDCNKSNRRSSYICEECGSSFTRKTTLKTHMLRKHFLGAPSLTSQARFECEICSRAYKIRGDLNVHRRIHSKDRRREFACDLCGKTYYEKKSLNSHKKIHNGDRYPCNVCGHRFTQKENLKKHMLLRQHFDKPQQFTPQSSNNECASMKAEVMSEEEFMAEGNDKESVPHAEETQQPTLVGDNEQQTEVGAAKDSVTCEVCHNSYPGELIKAHMRLTHNNKDYKCHFCSRSYTTNYSLMKHLRTHAKDRRREFACDLCEKTFYEKGDLTTHKKVHTRNGFPCKVCGCRFTRNESLNRHMIRSRHFSNPEPFTPQSSNDDVASMKTEVISDDEFIDEVNGSESVSHAEGTQQPAL